MSLVAERVLLRSPMPGKNQELVEGQRVRLSRTGYECLCMPFQVDITGTITKASARYPDSVAVIKDGLSTALHYNKAYWEPA